MDLQGVGAIASALVTFIGIPAAVLVGRAQTKAAVQAARLGAEAGRAQAQAAAQAGIAQAEATYRAALDASRDQARAEYRQWRHTMRREAWAQFATAVHEITTAAAELVSKAGPDEDHGGLKSACMAASRSVAFAYSVVGLEGPAQVAEVAGRVRERAEDVLLCAAKAVWVERAEALLRAIENGEGPAGSDIDHATAARDALHDLRTAARDQAEEGSHPIRAAGARNAAVADAWTRALTTLARCGITDRPATVLINDARQYLPPDNRLRTFHEAQAALERNVAEWTEAARAYLDGDGQG